MVTSRRRLAFGVVLLPLVLLLAWPRQAIQAQGTVLDRARKAAQDAANAGAKAVSDEANRQISSAVQDAAAENVADGSFIAVLSPWSSSDGTKQVEVARFAGAAFVATTSTGRQVIVCDVKGVLPWQGTFTILNTPNTGTAARGAGSATSTTGRGGRGGAAPPAGGRGGAARGSITGPATSGGAGASGSNGSAGSAEKSGSTAPSAGVQSYRFPTTAVTITLPATGAKAGNPSQGSITIANVSETILSGEAKIRFAQATIPGARGPQVVDFGVAFKARVLAAGDAPDGCLAPGTAKKTTATTPAPIATTPSTPGAGAAPSMPSAVTPPAAAGATFAEGDVLIPKIDNVKLLAAATDSARVAATLKSSDELVYLGDEQNGYVHVQGSAGEGWVRKALLKKR